MKRGDPGSPEINLPFPPGWEDMGPQTPPWAWGGMKFTGDPAMAANPPTIIALLSKLSGNVDPAKILEYAPGEMKNLPGYEGDGVGSASTLGGFDAWQVGGTYMQERRQACRGPENGESSPERTACLSCSSTPTAPRIRWEF